MDLGHTDAEWTRFLAREIGLAMLAPARTLIELRDRFRLERTQVVDLGDRASATPHFTAVTLTGANPGTNLAADGRLYVRFVANGGNWDVKLFKATGGGGGDEVARATNVAASATGTLVAQNSSGLAGSITLGAAIAADATDLHQLLVVQDYPSLLRLVFTGTDSVEDDADSAAELKATFSRVAAQIDAALATLVTGMRNVLLSSPTNPIGRGNKFGKSAEATLFSDVAEDDTSGTVTRAQAGLIAWLKLAMADETTGSTQDVVRRVPSAAAGVFPSANTGQGTVASHTPGEQAIPAIWRFRCVDDTLGSEQFEALASSTRTGDDTVIRGGAPLTVKKAWSGPNGFGPITLLRTRTKTGDGSNLNLAAASAFTEAGETSDNTNDGVLYWKIVANSSNWDVSFYKSSTYAAASLVAKATNVATGAAFQASEQNSSGLTINGTVGSAPVTTTTGTLVLNPFKRQNASRVPDEFSVTVSLAANPGLYQTLIAKLTGGVLNSDALNSESIPDAYAKANTFVPYVALDN